MLKLIPTIAIVSVLSSGLSNAVVDTEASIITATANYKTLFYVVALLLLFIWIVTKFTKTWFTKESDWVSVISYIFVVIWIAAAYWAFVWLLGMGGVIFN